MKSSFPSNVFELKFSSKYKNNDAVEELDYCIVGLLTWTCRSIVGNLWVRSQRERSLVVTCHCEHLRVTTGGGYEKETTV